MLIISGKFKTPLNPNFKVKVIIPIFHYIDMGNDIVERQIFGFKEFQAKFNNDSYNAEISIGDIVSIRHYER